MTKISVLLSEKEWRDKKKAWGYVDVSGYNDYHSIL